MSLMSQLVEELEYKTGYRKDEDPFCQPWAYFMECRNALNADYARKGIEIPLSQTEALVKRVARAIEIGGYLKLVRFCERAEWNVHLEHKDGTLEGINGFRRRKHAVQFIANMYLLALDKIR